MRHRSRTCAGLIGGALLLGAAPAPEPASITVAIDGLRSHKGQVLACLTAQPRGFPDCSKDPGARKMAVPADQAGEIVFAGVAPGTYAISLLHDENGNGRADMMLMIPREGFGFSRNPSLGFGPPSFNSASFAVGDASQRQSVHMRYML